MIETPDYRSIEGINAVYFEIEIENAAFRADAKERMGSTTAADGGFATEFREPMWSAGSFERFVRGTWCLLGPAGVSDTVPKCRASFASMPQRGVCRQLGFSRPGNSGCGGARATCLNTGVAASARRAM